MTTNLTVTCALAFLAFFANIFCPGMIIKKKGKVEKDKLSNTKKTLLEIATVLINIGCIVFLGLKETNPIILTILGLIAILSGIILIVDARVHIIPNMCLFPMLLLMLLYHIVLKDYMGIGNGFVAMFFTCYGILLLTKLLGFQGYFGAGDIKYLSVGAFMFGLDVNLVGFVVGWVASLFIVVIPLLLTKKITGKSMIAYGPYISVGMCTGLMYLYF